MERAQRRHREEPVDNAPLLAPGEIEAEAAGDGAAEAVPAVNVQWGAFTDALAVQGMTVADVGRLLRRPFGIPHGVMAFVNGVEVEPTHRLRAGDVLEFQREAGEKGAA
jgi:hypothetical protein